MTTLLQPDAAPEVSTEHGPAALPDLARQPLSPLVRRLCGWPAAVCLTLAALLFALAASRHWCTTFDEPFHAAAGYAYWTEPDGLRLNPENGCFPQRWAALPYLVSRPAPPPRDERWLQANAGGVGYALLHESGNSPDSLLLQGRAMIGLLMAGTALIVYAWARRLHGSPGGMLALALFLLCPVVLSNGVLITSDTAAMFSFTIAIAAYWWMLQALSPVRVLVAGAAIGLLAVTKMSAPLIVPMAAALVAVRLIWGTRPAGVSRSRELAGILAWSIPLAVVAIAVIWAFYGFRFAAIPPELAGKVRWSSEEGWLLFERSPSASTKLILLARDYHLLPEAFLYGYAYVAQFLQRQAFAAGLTWQGGQWWYFPYAFAVKMPLQTLLIAGLALGAAVAPRLRGSASSGRKLYAVAPLIVLIAAYWLSAVLSPMNLGVRHLLPTLPAIFILCGAAAVWFAARTRLVAGAVALLLVWLAVDVAMVYPNLLAYISPAVGGARTGHHRLVDSSYDWGQSLTQLRKWMDANTDGGAAKNRVHLIYFGMAKPATYGIDARIVFSFPDSPDRPRTIAPLEPGLYAVSSTMLQGCYLFPLGPWTEANELEYRRLQLGRRAFVDMMTSGKPVPVEEQAQWNGLLDRFEQFRAARLCALLRKREPVGHAGYAIKIFNVPVEDTQRAEFGELP